MYEKFTIPYQKRSLSALANRETDLWVHICGDTRHILHFLSGLDFQGFEVDAMVDLNDARKHLGSKALKGNLNTTFILREDAETVYKATLEMLINGNFKTGLVVSPGCGVPRMTPLGNLQAIMRACEAYRP